MMWNDRDGDVTARHEHRLHGDDMIPNSNISRHGHTFGAKWVGQGHCTQNIDRGHEVQLVIDIDYRKPDRAIVDITSGLADVRRCNMTMSCLRDLMGSLTNLMDSVTSGSEANVVVALRAFVQRLADLKDRTSE